MQKQFKENIYHAVDSTSIWPVIATARIIKFSILITKILIEKITYCFSVNMSFKKLYCEQYGKSFDKFF